MVQAAGDVRGVVDLPGPHLSSGLEARPDHVPGRLVHVREDRVVVAAEPMQQV